MTEINVVPFDFEAVKRLNRDMIQLGAGTMTVSEVRFLVDAYYMAQESRKAAANQLRALQESEEPNEVLDWWAKQNASMEQQIARVFTPWVERYQAGQWLLSQKGIGPVLAANFLAHLSVHPWKCLAPRKETKEGKKVRDVCTPDQPHEKYECGHIVVNTAGGFWRFCGLDPTATWEKGQKRPHNAAMKVACWKATDSFVKQGREPGQDAFYARLYRERKRYEVERNESGGNREYAIAAASRYKSAAARKVYESGRLSDGHVDARARRWVAHVFISHLHHVMYEEEFGTAPPVPFAIAHLGHVDYMAPPNWPRQEPGAD